VLIKRLAAAPLWYLVTLMGYGLVAYAAHAQDDLAPVFGLAVGLFVTVDPLHRIWPGQDESQSPRSALERHDRLPSHTQSV
jgi:hypothetical protein